MLCLYLHICFLEPNKYADHANIFSVLCRKKKGISDFLLMHTPAFWIAYLIPNYNFRSKSHSVLLCLLWFQENVLHWYYHWGTSNLLAYHNAITVLIFYLFIDTTVLLTSLSYLTEKYWIQNFQTFEKKLSDESIRKLECSDFILEYFPHGQACLKYLSLTYDDTFYNCGTIRRWDQLKKLNLNWTFKGSTEPCFGSVLTFWSTTMSTFQQQLWLTCLTKVPCPCPGPLPWAKIPDIMSWSKAYLCYDFSSMYFGLSVIQVIHYKKWLKGYQGLPLDLVLGFKSKAWT